MSILSGANAPVQDSDSLAVLTASIAQLLAGNPALASLVQAQSKGVTMAKRPDFKVYQKPFTKGGETVRCDVWSVEFRDHLNIRQRWSISTDRETADTAGRHLIELVRCRQMEKMPDPKLINWVNAQPDPLRDKICDTGLIDGSYLMTEETLDAHLDGTTDAEGRVQLVGYRQDLMHGRADRKAEAGILIGRIRRVFQNCGFIFWKHLLAPGVRMTVEAYLGKLRSEGYKDEKTGRVRKVNGTSVGYYVRELKGFAEWMINEGRAASNPFRALQKPKDVEVDSKDRAHLSLDELSWLCKVTLKRNEMQTNLTAQERDRLYRFAYETGLRPGAIRSLKVTSFTLDAKPPLVTTKAASNKRRKTHVQPLTPDMAAELAELFETMTPEAKAIRIPDKFVCADMLRADLAAARDAYLNEKGISDKERIARAKSDFLSPIDHQGLRRDFYSLRHSHGTIMGQQGMNQKDIQHSLHHTKSSTTDRYVHADLLAKARAVNSLPSVKPARPTGTGG